MRERNAQGCEVQTDGAYRRRASGDHAYMASSGGDQLDHEAAQRVPHQKWRGIQRGDECHQVVGVIAKAQPR
jgi:hypothetical protein